MHDDVMGVGESEGPTAAVPSPLGVAFFFSFIFSLRPGFQSQRWMPVDMVRGVHRRDAPHAEQTMRWSKSRCREIDNGNLQHQG